MGLELLHFPVQPDYEVWDSYAYRSKRLSELQRPLLLPETDNSSSTEGKQTSGLLSSLPAELKEELCQVKATEGKEKNAAALSLGLLQSNSKWLRSILLKLKAALEPRPFTQGSTADTQTATKHVIKALSCSSQTEPRLLLEPVFYEGAVQAGISASTVLSRLSARPLPDDDSIHQASLRLGLVPEGLSYSAQPLECLPLPRLMITSPASEDGHNKLKLYNPAFPPQILCSQPTAPLVSLDKLFSQLEVCIKPDGDNDEKSSAFGDSKTAHDCFALMMPELCPENQHKGCRHTSATMQCMMLSRMPHSNDQCGFESPLLPPPAASRSDVQDAISAELLSLCQPADEPKNGSYDSVRQLAPLTVHDVMAQDMVLDGAFQCLPPVIMADDSTTSQDTKDDITNVMATLRLKAHSLAPLELYLDWSLIDGKADGDAGGKDAASKLQAGLRPEIFSALPASTRQTHTLRLLIGVQQRAVERKERIAMPAQLLTIQAQLAQGASRQVEAPQAACADTKAKTPQRATLEEAGIPKRPCKRQVVTKAAPAADMSFFVGLQGSATPVRAGGGSEPDGEAVKEGEPDVRPISLPARHTELLADLLTDHKSLLSTIDKSGSRHAESDFLSPAALQEAVSTISSLTEDASDCKSSAYVQAVAAAAVLRQTGICLVHYGVTPAKALLIVIFFIQVKELKLCMRTHHVYEIQVRCAQIYLQHSVLQSKALASLCSRSSWSLSKALEDVENGSLEDHPKEAVLCSILTHAHDLNPGGKTLLLGDSCAFLAMYRVVAQAGLEAYQLDRHRALLSASNASSESLQQAVQTAVSAADCVLATYQHASHPGFPFSSFCSVVEYAPEAARDAHSLDALEQLPDVHRVVLTTDMDAVTEARKNSEEQQEFQAAGGEHPFGGAAAAMSAPNLPVHTAEEPTAGTPVEAEPWSVVISSSPGSAVRSQRDLYEAILLLERENAVIVERDMMGVDLVLSASTCLCLQKEQSSGLEALLQEWLPAQLVQISCAFSRCIICFEGSPAFTARLQQCLPDVHAEGRRAGITVQCFTSNSAITTQEVVLAAIKAVSQAVKTVLSDSPTAQQAFLEHFPAWNPFTAAAVAQALAFLPADQRQLPANIPGVTERSAGLFYAQIHSGMPVSTFLGNGDQPVRAATPEREALSTASDNETYTRQWPEELAQGPGPSSDPRMAMQPPAQSRNAPARAQHHLPWEQRLAYARSSDAAYALPSAHDFGGHQVNSQPWEPSAHNFGGHQDTSSWEPFESHAGAWGQTPPRRPSPGNRFMRAPGGYEQHYESCSPTLYNLGNRMPRPTHGRYQACPRESASLHMPASEHGLDLAYFSPMQPTRHAPGPRAASYGNWGSKPSATEEPVRYQASERYNSDTTYKQFNAQESDGAALAGQLRRRQVLHAVHEQDEEAGGSDWHHGSNAGNAVRHQLRHPNPRRIQSRADSFDDPAQGQHWTDARHQGPGGATRQSAQGVGSMDDASWEQAGAGGLQDLPCMPRSAQGVGSTGEAFWEQAGGWGRQYPLCVPDSWPQPPSSNRPFFEDGLPASPVRLVQGPWPRHGAPPRRHLARHQGGHEPRELAALNAGSGHQLGTEGWLGAEVDLGSCQNLEEEESYQTTPAPQSLNGREDVPQQTAESWDPATVLNRWLAKRDAGGPAPGWSGTKSQMLSNKKTRNTLGGQSTAVHGRAQKRGAPGTANAWHMLVKKANTGLHATC